MFKLCTSNWTKEYDTWWELIKDIKNIDYDDSYAHNQNDIFIYRYCFYNNPYFQTEIHSRNLVAYENGKIINLSEIREGVKNFIKQPEKRRTSGRYWLYKNISFEYRKEPVPFAGKMHYGCSYKRARHTYRSSYAKTMDCMQKPKEKEYLSSPDWWDDETPRIVQKNWKSQGKKRHQWEKI